MEKNYRKLYIWSFIIVSTVILLLMYTPMGGNLYQSTYGPQDYKGFTAVNFGTKINNAPKAHNRANNYQSSVPSVNQNSNYSALSSPVVGSSSASSHLSGNWSYQSNYTASSSNKATGSGGGGGGSMMALGSRGGSGGSGTAGGGGSFSGGGLFSSNAPGSNSNMQKSPLDVPFLAADPGGEEDLGNPLPVGDGLYLMLLMALAYGAYKFLK